MNKKYSLGGAFGFSGNQGFITSGSEDGDILFWDVSTKELIQKVQGHEGVVCWVDTAPGSKGAVVSAGLDGTVRIWVDVGDQGEDDSTRLRDLHLDSRERHDDDARDEHRIKEEHQVKDEPQEDEDMNGYQDEERYGDRGEERRSRRYSNDTPGDDMSIDRERSREREYSRGRDRSESEPRTGPHSPERMVED